MNRESKEQFKQELLARLHEKMGEQYQAEIHEVFKTNVCLDGIVLKERDNQTNVYPTIYLNPFYLDYESGKLDMDSLIEKLLEIYQNRLTDIPFDKAEFMDFSKTCKQIYAKLINTEKNEELLKSIPHVKFLDLSIVFYVSINFHPDSISSVLVNNSLREMWNTSTDELYRIACANTKTYQEAIITDMNDIIREALSDALNDDGIPYETEDMNCLLDSLDERSEYFMYVLSNQHRQNGAIHMTDTAVLEDFALKHGVEQVIIIPSSIHEVILLPSDNGHYLKYNQMVQEVNATSVNAEEVLSDHCYLYDQQSKTITLL